MTKRLGIAAGLVLILVGTMATPARASDPIVVHYVSDGGAFDPGLCGQPVQVGAACFLATGEASVDLSIVDATGKPVAAEVDFNPGSTFTWICGSASNLPVPTGTTGVQVWVGGVHQTLFHACPDIEPADGQSTAGTVIATFHT